MTSARTFGVEKGDTLIALEPARRNPGNGLDDSLQVFWGVTEVDLIANRVQIQSQNPDGTPTRELRIPLDEDVWGAAVFRIKLSKALRGLKYPTSEEYRELLENGKRKGYKL